MYADWENKYVSTKPEVHGKSTEIFITDNDHILESAESESVQTLKV